MGRVAHHKPGALLWGVTDRPSFPRGPAAALPRRRDPTRRNQSSSQYPRVRSTNSRHCRPATWPAIHTRERSRWAGRDPGPPGDTPPGPSRWEGGMPAPHPAPVAQTGGYRSSRLTHPPHFGSGRFRPEGMAGYGGACPPPTCALEQGKLIIAPGSCRRHGFYRQVQNQEAALGFSGRLESRQCPCSAPDAAPAYPDGLHLLPVQECHHAAGWGIPAVSGASHSMPDQFGGHAGALISEQRTDPRIWPCVLDVFRQLP